MDNMTQPPTLRNLVVGLGRVISAFFLWSGLVSTGMAKWTAASFALSLLWALVCLIEN